MAYSNIKRKTARKKYTKSDLKKAEEHYKSRKAREETYAAADRLDKIRKSFGLKTLREEIGL